MARRIAASNGDVPYLPEKRIEADADLLLAEYGEHFEDTQLIDRCQTALALLNSGNTAGACRLYRSPRKEGIERHGHQETQHCQQSDPRRQAPRREEEGRQKAEPEEESGHQGEEPRPPRQTRYQDDRLAAEG